MNPSVDAIILLVLLMSITSYVIFDRMFVIKNIVKIIVTTTILILTFFIFFHTIEIQNIAPSYRLLPAIATSLAFANVSRNDREGCGFIAGTATLIFFILLICMSIEYTSITGARSKYTNSPEDLILYSGKVNADKLSSAKVYLSFIIDENKIGKRNYKAAKVADLGIINEKDQVMRGVLTIQNPTAKRFWHTWLTGIYGIEYYQLWYPGGELKDNFDKIYYRSE